MPGDILDISKYTGPFSSGTSVKAITLTDYLSVTHGIIINYLGYVLNMIFLRPLRKEIISSLMCINNILIIYERSCRIFLNLHGEHFFISMCRDHGNQFGMVKICGKICALLNEKVCVKCANPSCSLKG